MSFENELNQLYEKIAYQVHDIIPTEWDTFCFNGEVKEKDGGVFFFFKPTEKEEYVYSHFIPSLYGLDKKVYSKGLHQLFQLTVDLQRVFIENGQEPWFSVTLILERTGKLNVKFDYTDWHSSEFGPSDRIMYFEYKYVRQSDEPIDMRLIEKMKVFEGM
ncbi:antitoxin YezG family protein [Rossellomorea marisflavi]|uniref:antitoxin YezG family protein n=1 Tax=Rossellomorea marisflavi TaxID=189381 RepID=UPI0027A53F1B|nr:antitoxin YezG family protein [Rossellomorea marisflavi]UTE73385.1 antitoxin YezG family protein [Rossellomorea marisflavi]